MTQDTVFPAQTGQIDEWFDTFIATLRVDQLQIQTNTAEENKKEVYKDLIEGNTKKVLSNVVVHSQQLFVYEIVKDFLSEIVARKVDYSRLAFDLSNTKVLVWVEIDDDDEQSEDGLILAQAKVNYNYQTYGYTISSTIVEQGDNIEVPSHYVLAELAN